MGVSSAGKEFCEEVGWIVRGWDVCHVNVPYLHMLSNVMVADINVLGSGMTFCILGQEQCWGIVNADDGGQGLWQINLK